MVKQTRWFGRGVYWHTVYRTTEKYDTFNLLRGTILSVRTIDGSEKDLEILGSIVEMGRCYKLLSYDEG